MSVQLRVHIAPIGYEARRVTKPLIDMQADRVYFIRISSDDTAELYHRQIMKELEQQYNHIEIRQDYTDIWDLYKCLEKFREIIFKEKKNQIFINVSSGTKVTAIAGMLSCMLWDANPYYAKVTYDEPKKIEQLPTENVFSPSILPVYDINKPSNAHMIVINLLEKNNNRMTKASLITELENANVIKPINVNKKDFTSAAKHSQLRSILQSMENDWKYVKVSGSGIRSEIILTEQGKNALRIFGCEEI